MSERLPTIEELKEERARWDQEHTPPPASEESGRAGPSDGTCAAPYNWEATRPPVDPADPLNLLAAEFCTKAAALGIPRGEEDIAGDSVSGHLIGFVKVHNAHVGFEWHKLFVDADAGQILRTGGFGPTYRDGFESPTTLPVSPWPLEPELRADLATQLVEAMYRYLRSVREMVFIPPLHQVSMPVAEPVSPPGKEAEVDETTHAEATHLRELEAENAHLKRLLAERDVEIDAMLREK